jgi:hypothetical protein
LISESKANAARFLECYVESTPASSITTLSAAAYDLFENETFKVRMQDIAVHQQWLILERVNNLYRSFMNSDEKLHHHNDEESTAQKMQHLLHVTAFSSVLDAIRNIARKLRSGGVLFKDLEKNFQASAFASNVSGSFYSLFL